MIELLPDETLRCKDWRIRTSSGWEGELLNISVKRGEALALVGRAGSGKTLALERLGGILRPGVEESGDRRIAHAALVPQDARVSVLPTDRVWTLLGLDSWAIRVQYLSGYRWAASEREDLATDLMRRLRLDAKRLAALPFRDLSMSERRGVLVCSALASKPQVLLLDGWDEMMDAHGRRALANLLQSEIEKGLSLLVASRSFPLRDFPNCADFYFGPAPFDTQLPVPLVRRAKFRSTHEHPLLEVSRLSVSPRRLGVGRRRPPAFPLNGATLFVRHHETLVVLGASGSGKTKLLETIAGLTTPSSGTIRVSGQDVTHARGRRARRLRRDVQLVFQDATSALDGQRSVESHLNEAMRLSTSRTATPKEWLEKLGLSPRLMGTLSDRLSSSECQRINLARCLILSPKLVLYDCPEVSAADTDGGLMNSVIAAEKTKGTAFLVTTCSPTIAKSLGDRVAILHAGRIVELGTKAEVLERPAHPVTRALLSTELLAPRDPTSVRNGCPHVGQCSRRTLPECDTQEPMLAPLLAANRDKDLEMHGIRRVACFHPLECGTALIS